MYSREQIRNVVSNENDGKLLALNYVSEQLNLETTKTQIEKIFDSNNMQKFDFEGKKYGFATGECVNGKVYAKMYDSSTMELKPHIFEGARSVYDYFITDGALEEGKIYFGWIKVVNRSEGMKGVPYMFVKELEIDMDEDFSLNLLNAIQKRYSKEDMQRQFLFRLLTQSRMYFPIELMWYIISDEKTLRTPSGFGDQKDKCERLDQEDPLKNNFLELIDKTILHTKDSSETMNKLVKLIVLSNGDTIKGIYVLFEEKKLILRYVYTLVEKKSEEKKILVLPDGDKFLEALRLDHIKELNVAYNETENDEIKKIVDELDGYYSQKVCEILPECNSNEVIRNALKKKSGFSKKNKNYIWNYISRNAKGELIDSVDKNRLLQQVCACTVRCGFQLIDSKANEEDD